MSNAYNKTTGEYRQSVHTPDFGSSEWILNPNMPEGIPAKYCVWDSGKGAIREMTQEEKTGKALAIKNAADARRDTMLIELAGELGVAANASFSTLFNAISGKSRSEACKYMVRLLV